MTTIYLPAFRTVISGSDLFVAQIEGLLGQVAGTIVGSSLLLYFGNEAYAVRAEAPTTDVALGIVEYKKAAFGGAKPPIETQTCITWRDQPARPLGISNEQFAAAAKIPFVRFPGPDFRQDPLRIADGILVGHKDFPDGTPLDVVLAHELCHAYLSAAGISPIWEAGKAKFTANVSGLTCATAAIYTGVEEQIVCGLLAGRGLSCCENTYRFEKGYPPRTTYLDVGIRDATLAGASNVPELWVQGAVGLAELSKTFGSSIAVVLNKNSWPDAAADFGGAVEATVKTAKLREKMVREMVKRTILEQSLKSSGLM
jgi:hypothetical protein